MLPGDIDLTENIDFRKTRRKEISQLPDSWRGKKSDDNNFKISNNLYLDSTITYTSNSIFTISTQSSQLSINDHSMIYNFDSVYYNHENNTVPIYYTIQNNTYSSYNINYNNDFDNIIKVYFKNEPEYDVFGNKIEPLLEYIDPIPWKERNTEQKISKIPWDSHYYNRFIRIHNYMEAIPWNYDGDDLYDDNKSKFSIDNAGEFISWLKGQSISFIKRYLNRDKEDNSSYLTNMSWIGVNDAIIE